jgi:hypothetical protein
MDEIGEDNKESCVATSINISRVNNIKSSVNMYFGL